MLYVEIFEVEHSATGEAISLIRGLSFREFREFKEFRESGYQ